MAIPSRSIDESELDRAFAVTRAALDKAKISKPLSDEESKRAAVMLDMASRYFNDAFSSGAMAIFSMHSERYTTLTVGSMQALASDCSMSAVIRSCSRWISLFERFQNTSNCFLAVSARGPFSMINA